MKSRRIKTNKTAALIIATLATAIFQSLFIVNEQLLLTMKPFEGMALIASTTFPFIASMLSTMFLHDDENHGIMIRNTIILYAIVMTYFICQVVI